MTKDVRISSETHKMLFQLKIDLGLKSIEQVILALKKNSDALTVIRELQKHKLERAGVTVNYELKEWRGPLKEAKR